MPTPDTCKTARYHAVAVRHPAGDLVRVSEIDAGPDVIGVFTAADFADLAEICAKLKPQGKKEEAKNG